jgi:hypothetical protein
MNVLRNWFRFLSSAHRSPVPRPRRHQLRRAPQRPQLEALESRTMPAVIAFMSGTHLIVDGDASGNTIRVDTVGSGDLRQERISYLAGGSYVEVGQFGGFSDVLINSGAGNDVVNINGTINPGAPITINGNGGDDVVNLNGFARDTTVLNPGYTDLHITDPLGSFSTTATVSRSSVILAHPGGADGTYVIHYTDGDLSGLAINLGNAGNTVVVIDTPSNPARFPVTTVAGGAGVDTINVRGTTGSLTVVGHGPNTTVMVGNPTYGLQDIQGQVKLQGNFDGRTTLNVDNTGDPSDHLMARQVLPGVGFDVITGLAPADISYRGVQTGAVHITLGSGANTFTVEGTNTAGDGSATTLDTGTGNAVNIVNVLKTDSTTPLTVVGHGPNTTVNVGNLADGVQDIRGNVKLQGNFSGRTTLVVDNTGDGSAHLMARQILPGDGFDYIHNLAPADISYRGVQTSAVTITLGSGANNFTVENTNTAGSGDATTLNTGTGNAANTVTVLRTDQTTPLIVVGRGPNTTLVGPSAPSIYNITGRNAGNISSGASVSFSNIQNLTGGSGNDAFVLADGAGVDGNISDMGGAANTLDYRAYSTSVIVDLQTGFATGVGGAVSGITVVFGGTGNGALGAYNLLIGNGGNVLTGGFGRRNVLVAGGTASTLNGGDQDDLLIGGSTAYDTEAGLVSWQAIAAYWAGTDDYSTRVANLTSGTGVPLLDATTVFGNGGGSTINGNGELALIYSDGLDNFTLGPPYPPGFDPNSVVVPITP